MSDENQGLDLGAPPEPAPDPFAEVPADAGAEPEPAEGTLSGDGGTLDDLEGGEAINGGAAPEPGEFLEDPEAATAAEPEPEAEPAPAAPDPEAAAAPEPEVPAAAKAPKAKPVPDSEAKEKKSGSSVRLYAVLMKNPETGEWGEPFESGEEGVPGGIEAANGEIALREAYNRLVPETEERQIELVVFPTHYWKPKKVGAKAVARRSVTIE